MTTNTPASSASFTVERELSSALTALKQNERALSKTYVYGSHHDAWIRTQLEVNHLVYRMARQDSDLKHVKVMSTFRKPVIVHRLLDTLKAATSVESLAVVGIHVNESHARQLVAALTAPGSSLSCLQLCRVLPESLAILCHALQSTLTLRELRLTFHHDLSLEDIEIFSAALAKNQSIEVLKLYCVDFCAAGLELLADSVRENTTLRDLRLTSCNLTDVESLVLAVQESKRIQRLDLSMNRISDNASLAVLLETPSIIFLNLSQNLFGATDSSATDYDDDAVVVYKSLRCNTTLKSLYLDMCPVTIDFAFSIKAALECNTSLIRLGLLTRTLSCHVINTVSHPVHLNEAGRGIVIRESKALPLLPHLLGRVSMEPHLLYGLLKERTDLWAQHRESS
jgi:hypothetical protein